MIKDIGIPKDAETYVGIGDLIYRYPIPRKNSHKGENGRVLVVGGGPYTGAPAISALSAYRVGADLVHIACPESVYTIISSYSPNFIVHKLNGDILNLENVDAIKSIGRYVDVMLIGPGAGNDTETKKCIHELVKCIRIPMVIDANGFDGINTDIIKNKNIVITPHTHEFKKLTGIDLPDDVTKKVDILEDFANEMKITILLKGNIDIITAGNQTKLNRTGNPAMSVGGTGDVLSGVLAGLLGKGMDRFYASCLAAFITGYAGDLAFKEKSYSLLATDVIDKIPDVIKSIYKR